MSICSFMHQSLRGHLPSLGDDEDEQAEREKGSQDAAPSGGSSGGTFLLQHDWVQDC